MEPILAILVGLFFTASIYLLMSRSLIRLLLGVALFGNAVNMMFFTAGRLTRDVPPIVPSGMQVPEVVTANPLPQALVLTAIVISFSFFAFLLVLVYRAYQDLGTDQSSAMRMAEPAQPKPPVQGY